MSLSAVSIGKGLQVSIKEKLFNISSDISISSYENDNRGIASEIIQESEDIINEIKTLYPDIRINSILEKPSIVTIDSSIETIIFRGIKNELNFKNIEPGKYHIRIIFDENNNGKYDTGDFLNRIMPEKVTYFPDLIEIRAGWDLVQEFILNE